jgi:ABC-type multidrug transport system fused ATPase/permease subunit
MNVVYWRMFSIFHRLILVDLLFLLAHFVSVQSIGDKLETLSKKFEDEKKMIKQEIMSKESEITQLKAALQEEKHANGRLRALWIWSLDLNS